MYVDAKLGFPSLKKKFFLNRCLGDILSQPLSLFFMAVQLRPKPASPTQQN